MSRSGVVAALGAAAALAGSLVAWQSSGSDAAASRPTAADGASLFHAKGCASCHIGPDSAAAIGDAFPSLANAPEWAAERRAGASAAEYLAESIREPWAFRSPAFRGGVGPTEAMPALGLSEVEIDALVDYLLHRS